MKWKQIKKKYTGNWILIDDVKVNGNMNVMEGNVIYFHPDKENVYKKLLELKPKKSTIEFAGDIPEIAVML